MSAPGQATTSRASSAPGRAMSIASRRAYSVASWLSVSPRYTRFWRFVTRTSAPSSRWIEASARNWSDVMSPSRAQAYADTVPFVSPRTTFACSQRPYGAVELICTGVPWPIGVGVIPDATPAGASPSF